METLPDIWTGQTASRLLSLATLMSQDSEFLDWRKFIVLASDPMPRPSRVELFDALSRFLETDSEKTGFVSAQQFSQVYILISKYL